MADFKLIGIAILYSTASRCVEWMFVNVFKDKIREVKLERLRGNRSEACDLLVAPPALSRIGAAAR